MILSGRSVIAVLGPTNTGKTHYAIERMIAHGSGMIGLPLRLLAREVYTRLVERVGANNVALITGEEKITPPKIDLPPGVIWPTDSPKKSNRTEPIEA